MARWHDPNDPYYMTAEEEEAMRVRDLTPDEIREELVADLLLALREIADGCCGYRPGHVSYEDNRTKDEIREIAQRAIAKASE